MQNIFAELGFLLECKQQLNIEQARTILMSLKAFLLDSEWGTCEELSDLIALLGHST